MEVLVYGAGALGSLVGGLLARTHEVTLVGRDPHMRRVREDGLRIDGEVDAHVHPRALTDGRHRSADLAVVTTKAYDTDAAARALATGEYDAVCSLQNGLTEERLVAALDPTVLAGTASYGARFAEPGRVTCTGVGEVAVGTLSGGTDPLAERVGSAFDEAGIETTVAADMPRRRYEKLAVNAGINGPSALARLSNGATLDGPGGEAAREAAREVARIARADGVGLGEEAVVDAVERVAAATAANRSSMREDVTAGRRTEVDAIYGAALDRADRFGVSAPTCRTIASLIRGWEVGAGVRPAADADQADAE
ncbi:2-dehydropantoate 2-reductase [Halorubrum saccharovorum DSM 1137]|uniref:2-dehydropantoate 2-reductase n=1 Tax=Halorubrum saccharovorum DSM 1137 TaxID=1227484 RepID=M0DSA2_9EURY|nr:ketopantoate reductase family protein [Halorubrum saccharovorum]ELZ37738.1 2-dehydropantoate 2-reductase [Halorubrum saccharovorum DSM 1137]